VNYEIKQILSTTMKLKGNTSLKKCVLGMRKIRPKEEQHRLSSVFWECTAFLAHRKGMRNHVKRNVRLQLRYTNVGMR
jgi:hypothetical protein